MTAPLETELDELFRLPPAEMVAARNALADRLRKAGDKAAAASVKAIKRPTPAAWALNQVHFQHAALLDRARAETAALRELHQLGGDAQRLSAAIAAQRNAMYAVIEAATRCCQAAGMPGDGALQRKLYTSLQAWLAGQGDEAPGRMTRDIEASGFDAITAMGLPSAAAPPSAPAPPPEPQAEPSAPDPEEIERATALVAERERQAREASAAFEQRRAELEQAEHAVELARGDVRAAEEALRSLRTVLSEREVALSRVRVARDAAEQARLRAERAVAEAQDALSALPHRR